jgi:hypothetical protein
MTEDDISNTEVSVGEFQSDQAVESAAFAGAAAIQRLIAERNGLRNRLAAQERELVATRAAQDDLRRRLGKLHQRYLELARKVVSQMEQFDGSIREALRGGAPDGNTEDAAGLKRQFDGNGLPVGPQQRSPHPVGFNGAAQGNGPPPIEP